VADTLDATLNDVVLAMCAGALRRYLVDRGELPKKALTAAVPVSIRRPDSDAGNEVAFTMTTLATNLRDPAKRLQAIKSGMDYNKERLRKLSPGQVMAYTAAIMIPGQLNSLLGRSRDSELGNVVISHVPGPRKTMYWQGAKLAGLYPISLNIDGGALNITLVSRHDFVDFGLIACRKAVPSVQRLLEYLEEELVALEAATGTSGGAATKGKSGRKKSTRRKASGSGGAGRGKARAAKASTTGRRKAAPRRKT
jgi:diacylglycerol O-acyltransferase